MADPTQDPGYVARLIKALQNMGGSIYSAASPKANPTDPDDPTGKGGAAHKAALDKQIADAGG